MTTPVSTREAMGRELAKLELPLLGAGVGTLGLARYLSHYDLASGPVLCPLRRFTGIPCPFCGMTTSFAHLAGGRVWDSFVASPAGPLIFLATVAGIVALIWALVRRRRISLELTPEMKKWAYRISGVILLLLMVYQSFRIGPLHPLLT